MDWLTKITDKIDSSIDSLRTCKPYEGELTVKSLQKEKILGPAILVSCAGFQLANNQPGDGTIAYTAVFNAFLVAQGASRDKVTANILSLAVSLANLVDTTNFGIDGAKAGEMTRCTNATNVGFTEKGVQVMVLTWRQDIIVGESMWVEGDIMPIDLRFSWEPQIGLPHKDDYQQVTSNE
jgi:phage gp37-like protein